MPKVRGADDTQNFDKEFTSERVVDSVVSNNRMETTQSEAEFGGFTYKGDSAMK